jgi:hypothetical protein
LGGWLRQQKRTEGFASPLAARWLPVCWAQFLLVMLRLRRSTHKRRLRQQKKSVLRDLSSSMMRVFLRENLESTKMGMRAFSCIQLLDKDGRVVWSAGKTKAKLLSASIAKWLRIHCWRHYHKRIARRLVRR